MVPLSARVLLTGPLGRSRRARRVSERGSTEPVLVRPVQAGEPAAFIMYDCGAQTRARMRMRRTEPPQITPSSSILEHCSMQ